MTLNGLHNADCHTSANRTMANQKRRAAKWKNTNNFTQILALSNVQFNIKDFIVVLLKLIFFLPVEEAILLLLLCKEEQTLELFKI